MNGRWSPVATAHLLYVLGVLLVSLGVGLVFGGGSGWGWGLVVAGGGTVAYALLIFDVEHPEPPPDQT